MIVIGNDMVNDEERKERWQVQVNVHPTGGCTPTQGDRQYVSSWLDAGAETGVELSVGECVFRIDVSMRQANFRTDCWYTAELTWDPAGGTTPSKTTSSPRTGPTGWDGSPSSAKPPAPAPSRRTRASTSTAPRSWKTSPGSSANADLLELARRAAAIATFAIRVEPDSSDGAVPAGCNRTATLVGAR